MLPTPRFGALLCEQLSSAQGEGVGGGGHRVKGVGAAEALEGEEVEGEDGEERHEAGEGGRKDHVEVPAHLGSEAQAVGHDRAASVQKVFCGSGLFAFPRFFFQRRGEVLPGLTD